MAKCIFRFCFASYSLILILNGKCRCTLHTRVQYVQRIWSTPKIHNATASRLVGDETTIFHKAGTQRSSFRFIHSLFGISIICNMSSEHKSCMFCSMCTFYIFFFVRVFILNHSQNIYSIEMVLLMLMLMLLLANYFRKSIYFFLKCMFHTKHTTSTEYVPQFFALSWFCTYYPLSSIAESSGCYKITQTLI